MRLKAAGATHVGMKRQQNQDHFVVLPEVGLFVVADGMGGHRGGETASLLAAETISEVFREKAGKKGRQDVGARLREAITAANGAIQERARKEAALQGMGTTTTALAIEDDHAFLGQVGDSRAYLVRGGKEPKIWQLTRDHSLVQEKMRAGLITREQVKTDRMKNVITRSVGYEADVEVDLYWFEVHKGDTFVLCSDGLSGMVPDEKIRDIVCYGGEDVEAAVGGLIEAANKNGGDDNVTAVIVRMR